MIKKILLIDPQGFGSGLNLGLGYLAAVLLKNNYQVRVVDCNNTPDRLVRGPRLNLNFSQQDWQEKVDRGLRWKPEVIGISLNSFSLEEALAVVKYCRGKTGREVIYIAGGPHLVMAGKLFMEQYHYLFDFACYSEGEESFPDLLKHLHQPEEVKGIFYYDAEKKVVVQTEPRPLINNLDSLPFPDFTVFDTVNPKRGLYNYQMISSRGCPYGCVFCFKICGRQWRPRSPENVLAEIKFAKKKYHFSTLTFWDDNFTFNLERAKKICHLFIENNLKLSYSLAGVRADRVDEEMIQKLKESGCTHISMGIEDGDPQTFPLVGKGETLAQIEKTVSLIKKYKITLLAYMVTGLINHDYRSFLRSLKFIEKLKVQAHWSIAFPFPGTPLFDWAQHQGRFLMTLEEGFSHSMTSKNPPVVFDTLAYPKEERLRAYYLGNLRSKSYDMLTGSRRGNIFQQAFDIIQAIWQYDRQKTGWHFSNLLNIFLKWQR